MHVFDILNIFLVIEKLDACKMANIRNQLKHYSIKQNDKLMHSESRLLKIFVCFSDFIFSFLTKFSFCIFLFIEPFCEYGHI